jgi:parallel beta-helix repeat protein
MMKRTAFAFAVIFLIFETGIVPAIAHETNESSYGASRGNWLYVGGSGPGNYTSIQDAIDNTTDGDTVYVFPGTYAERIVIPNTISLLGSNASTTVIDGEYNNDEIITCIGSDIIISGFTIQKSTFNHSCILINHTAGCVIDGNIIQDTGSGITTRNAHNISITQNSFYQISNGYAKGGGVHLVKSSYCEVLENRFINNQNQTKNENIGIAIYTDDDCHRCTLSQNTISFWMCGIYIYGTHLLITHNEILDTTYGAADALTSLHGCTTKQVTIRQNLFKNNKQGIHLCGSTDYSIENNVIQNSSLVGIYILEDTWVGVIPENVSIKDNHIMDSVQGIVSENSINMTIEGNHIHHNTLGLLLHYNTVTSVKRNTFQDNNKNVFYLWAFFPMSLIPVKVPRFDRNFWDQPHESPYPIAGRLGLFEPCIFFDPIHIFPWVTFDWHPAEDPYDIGGGMFDTELDEEFATSQRG